tara:strand:- start:402 stop:635 length:234 start_codon:yes stop_codon:yes gene_type:complete
MKNDLTAMQNKFIELVIKLKNEGNDPLAIAGCLLAGAVNIYHTELGHETTSDLLDQIANGRDEDYEIDFEVDKETYH